MCLPFVILKPYVFFAGLVHIGIGIAIIVLGGMLVNDNSNLFYGDTKSYKDSANIGFIVLGSIIILSGVCGIIGGIKRLKCVLFIFSIFTFIFLIIFVVLLALCIIGS